MIDISYTQNPTSIASVEYGAASEPFLAVEYLRGPVQSPLYIDSSLGVVKSHEATYQTHSTHDELLLPHRPFDYSEYAAKLFQNGSINSAYVKKVNTDGTLVISIPVEDPLKAMAQVSGDYINLRVDILYYITQKALAIWKKDIFNYACMNGAEAIQDILNKLNEGLAIKYPDEESQRHAKRAIELFRWYCEMAILSHSDYLLHLKYTDAVADFVNGNAGSMPNLTFQNLQFTAARKFEVLDNTQNGGFTMQCDSDHETSLCFDGYFTNGGTITINGTSENITSGAVNVQKTLPTGHISVTLEIASGGTQDYISALALTNYTVIGYKMTYAGKVGDSNPTLDYLLKYLTIAGESIESAQEALANGAPPAYALEELRRYFEIHHLDKDKGRRLIDKTI